MSSLGYKSSILKHFFNLVGWKTNRKIVVIESDDWGSIRMPNKTVYQKFVEYGFDLENTSYNRLDSLESDKDMECLFEVLSKFKDINGNSPVFTANYIVANPDFEKIRQCDYQHYNYETIEDTMLKYPGSSNILRLAKAGESAGIFHPQFHGREHLNIKRWMHDLQTKSEKILFTFSQNTTYSGTRDYNYMAAFDYHLPKDIQFLSGVLEDGLNIFERIFDYRSKSIIAPCYVWDGRIETALKNNKVEYLQGGNFQLVPTKNFEVYKKRYNYTGKKNIHNQVYLVRNNSFEPSLMHKNNWINYVIDSMNIAFKLKKPSIITSHRINYIGSLNESNRSVNLALLEELLQTILAKFPDVEFMTSDALGDLITSG